MTVTAAAQNFDEVVRRAHELSEATLLLEDGHPLARVVPVLPRIRLAWELAAAWRSLPHLTQEEAEEFAADLAKDRANVLPSSKWE